MLGRNYRITVDPSRGSSSNILVLGFCFFCFILKFIRNFPEIPLGIHPGFLPKFIASYVLEFRESIVTTMGETFVQGFLHEFLLRSFQGFLKQFPWGFFFCKNSYQDAFRKSPQNLSELSARMQVSPKILFQCFS